MAHRATVSAICILFGLCFQTAGQGCPEPAGHWGYGRHVTAAWHGELALIASGPKLLVVDFRLGAPQSVIGEVRLPGDAIALAVSEDLAVAGVRASHSSDALLVTVDLNAPTEPVVLGRLGISRTLSDVELRGSVALVTSLSEGLVLVDVSEPADPRRLSAVPSVSHPQSVVVRGDFAYLGSREGLITVDIASSARPFVASQQPISGYRARLALSDSNLFFLTENGLTVFGISDLERPTRLSVFETYGSPLNLDVAGTRVFITQYHAGGIYSMAIIDATDPLELRRIGAYHPNERIDDVAVADQAALLSLGVSGTQLVDASDPTFPQLFAELAPPAAPGDMVDVAIDADRGLAFLADTGGLFWSSPPFGWLRIVDVTEAGGFHEIASLGFDEPVRRVARFGDHVLILRDQEEITPATLEIIDTSEPGQPTVVGDLQLSGPVWGELVVSGDYAYVTDSLFNIVDLSDPTAPVLVVKTHGAGGSGDALTVVGNRAFLAGGLGFCIIDVSDPTDPIQVSCTPVGGYGSGIAVRDHVAFVSVNNSAATPSSTGELRMFDLTDESAPVELGSIRLWGPASRLSIDGNLLFVRVVGRGLLVIDVSDPRMAQPVGLARVEARGVGAGGRLFAASGFQGLDVFDTASCSAPAPSPDFVWSPREPTVGEEVEFTDISPGGPTSWAWEFGDEAVGDGPVPRHTFSTPGRKTVTLTAANANGVSAFDAWIPVQSIADPMNNHWIVPAAAHGAGKAETRWTSDLTLVNTNLSETEAIAYLMKQGEDNTLTLGKRLSLQRGATVFEDVVASVFGEERATGAIFMTSDSGLRISSRTATLSDRGSFGQSIPAVNWRNPRWRQTLIQLTQNEAFRSNLGLVNRLGSPLTVEAYLTASDGSSIAETSYTVEPYGHLQVNGFIAEISGHEVDDGALTLWGGPHSDFIAYVSTVDNTTGDPVFMLQPQESTEPLWIPAAAHVRGRNGTMWRTDLEVCATLASDAEYRIELFESGRANPAPEAASFTLEPGHCVRYADVIQGVFETSTTGALRIVPSAGVVSATSRTYTRRADGGTYGQYIAAIRESDAIGAPGYGLIPQLSQSADPEDGFRTNIGLVNLTADPVGVKIEVRAGDFTALHTVEIELAGFEHRQLDRFLDGVEAGDLVNAMVAVQSQTNGARFLAYASVVDNASGDAVFLPTQ